MTVPYLVQYQGSKKAIVSDIVQYIPSNITRLIEPFCRTAAISIRTAMTGKVKNYLLNDVAKSLVDMISECIDAPDKLARDYQEIWEGQFKDGTNNIDCFYIMRDKFNQELLIHNKIQEEADRTDSSLQETIKNILRIHYKM